jgi:hypothetical protein
MSNARNLANLLGTGTQITTADIADGAFQANKNLIINGAMQVAQRGTSFSGITDQYTLDRWTSSSAGGVSLNVSQQTATSTDNGYFASKDFARYQRNAVLSGFVHKVEDLQQFNNKIFTLSFWAKSADAGTNVTLTAYTVNDGSTFNSYVTRTYVTNPTLSSTWQKYEVRLAFQDMYAYGYSGSHHLRLQFFDGANAATFDISEVQLEVGEQATPFEHRSYGDELARCQRYYYNTYLTPQASGSASDGIIAGQFNVAEDRYFVNYIFPTTMRADPSVVFYGGRAGVADTADRVTRHNADTLRSFTNEPSGRKQGVYGFFDTNTTDEAVRFHFTADAEL